MEKKKATPSWQTAFINIELLGEGGNAQVFRVQDRQSGEHFALKELTNLSKEKKSRFRSEIKIARENSDTIPGILPIIQYNIDVFWYTMPVADKIMDQISKMTIVKIVQGTIQLCETLESLHAKGISHRDIKPANIYYYNDRFTFGDFGLVDFPDAREHYTASDKWLGAFFTIAPEMKRNPKTADGRKADIYSLAKTLWMFLSGNEKGFDGVYDYLDPIHSLRSYDKLKDIHIVEIEELLKDSTNTEPTLRPTSKEFKIRLQKWIEVYTDVDKSQVSDWDFLRKQIFGPDGNLPDAAKWKNLGSIVSVLNKIGKTPAYNHMFFSDGGGLDFSHSEIAPEPGCIYIYDDWGTCSLLKPTSLEYEGFPDDIRWDYFILELDNLDPIFAVPTVGDCERLVEDHPGHYVDPTDSVYGVYDYDSGEPLPEGSKTVFRYIRGRLLFVMKFGHYNHINAAYDGRHGKFESCAKFREYMDFLVKRYNQYYSKLEDVIAEKKVPLREIDHFIFRNEVFRYNPFQSKESLDYENTKLMSEIDIMRKETQCVRERLLEWNFLSFLPAYEITASNITYYFEFHFSRERGDFDFFDRSGMYLRQNGTVCRMKEPNATDCIFATERQMAKEIKRILQQAIRRNITNAGLDSSGDDEQWVEIEIRKAGPPTHLFTKSEIEQAMRIADDRKSNKLVIDENGVAAIIDDGGMAETYPVVHETWCAGNNYVGKYSPLSTLDEDYLLMLYGWLRYLQTSQAQYADYIPEDYSEECLINEISEFYQ